METQPNLTLNMDAVVPDNVRVQQLVHIANNSSEELEAYKSMRTFLENLTQSLMALKMTDDHKNTMFKVFDAFLTQLQNFQCKLLKSCSEQIRMEENLHLGLEFIRTEVRQSSTSYRRHKIYRTNPNFIAPTPMAIGTRWEARRVKHVKLKRKIYIPRLIRNTFYYVSILEILETLFADPVFSTMYFEYNNRVVEPNVYSDFRSGSRASEIEIFQDPAAIQLQIAYDDFEICNPLGPVAGRHNISGFYLSIRNVPIQFRSKIDNIYINCVCNANDLKTQNTDYNNVWDVIVRDVQELEQKGVIIDRANNVRLRGTIVQLAGDNMAVNSGLGFSGSFSASFYCRICMMSHEECQRATIDDPTKHRTKQNYEDCLRKAEELTKADLKVTKGIKYNCNLNKCEYFHIIENPTVDIMHDVLEGAIPFALKQLFIQCIAAKLFTIDQLNSLVIFHNYGSANTPKKPSNIFLDKQALGQTASQMLCLFLHLPLILYKFRENIAVIQNWPLIESLYYIVEIVFSIEIEESDIQTLDKNIHSHLKCLREQYKVSLLPKHHFILHYPMLIRRLGPLVHFMMMRYESKHQQLKQFVKNTHNFRNIVKTMAIRHQQNMVHNGFTYVNSISHGKQKEIGAPCFNLYKSIFAELQNIELHEVLEINNLKINDCRFECGFVVLKESNLFHIQKILIVKDYSFLVCKEFVLVELDEFSKCFKVKLEQSNDLKLIMVNELKIKQTFELSCIGTEQFLICENVHVRKALLSRANTH